MATASEEPVSLETGDMGGGSSAERVEASQLHQQQQPNHQPAASASADAMDTNEDDVVDITRIDPRAVDSMLAKEIQQLSFQEREAVSEVRHHFNYLSQNDEISVFFLFYFADSCMLASSPSFLIRLLLSNDRKFTVFEHLLRKRRPKRLKRPCSKCNKELRVYHPRMLLPRPR